MLRYTAPKVIRIGRIEELTGQLRKGPKDLLHKGNLL